MHKSNRRAFKNLILIFADLLCILFAFTMAIRINCVNCPKASIYDYLWALLIFTPIFGFLMESLNMYNTTTFNYYDRIFKNVFLSTLFGSIILFGTSLYISEPSKNIKFIAAFFILSLCSVLIIRYIFVGVLKKYRKVGASKAIIIGCDKIAKEFRYYLKKTSIKIDIIGFVRVNGEKMEEDMVALGHITNMEQIIKDNVFDEVIFALPRSYMGEVEKYIGICEAAGLTVKIIPDLFDLNLSKTFVHSVGTLPVLTFHTVCLNDYQIFLKRCLDIAGAVVGLLITGIASIFVIPAIKLESKGPVFFKQERVGQNGRIFHMYKFRSMVQDAEELKAKLAGMNEVESGLMFKIENDPRVTKIGAFLRKTSIDELPQFWNVLTGEMSLVGTRPPTIDEVDQYQNKQRRRISIKPGITGMWQVSGRSAIKDFDEVVELDTQYIDNWTLASDIKILFKTVWSLLKRKGAY